MGLSEQVAELRAAQDEVAAQITTLADRVLAKLADLEAKIVAAGEPDPDLAADIQELRDNAEQLKAIAASE